MSVEISEIPVEIDLQSMAREAIHERLYGPGWELEPEPPLEGIGFTCHLADPVGAERRMHEAIVLEVERLRAQGVIVHA